MSGSRRDPDEVLAHRAAHYRAAQETEAAGRLASAVLIERLLLTGAVDGEVRLETARLFAVGELPDAAAMAQADLDRLPDDERAQLLAAAQGERDARLASAATLLVASEERLGLRFEPGETLGIALAAIAAALPLRLVGELLAPAPDEEQAP